MGRPIIAMTRRLRPRASLASRRASRSATRIREEKRASSGSDLTEPPRPRAATPPVAGGGRIHHDPVAEEHHPVGPAGVPGLVRDQDAGGTAVAAATEQPKNGLARLGVKRPGRLVGEYEASIAN